MVKYILRSGKPLKRKKPSGCGSAWLERLIWDQEVAGSNPVTPMKLLKLIIRYFAGVVQW